MLDFLCIGKGWAGVVKGLGVGSESRDSMVERSMVEVRRCI